MTTMADPASLRDLTGHDSVIELDRVSVRFHRRGKEEFVAVRELSFAIPRGQIFCLLGPNGSGKTTTINLICGLRKPTDGQVRVFGQEPHKERKTVLRNLAVMPQETALYDSLNARENLLFHGNYYGVSGDLKAQVGEVLKLVQLTDRQNDRVGTYSGGMQRRLTLARALLTKPQALLLDEPTLGVDVQSRQAIWDRVRELADGGMSVLLSTNYMEEAETLADRILIIDRGAAVAEGTLAELKAKVTALRLVLRFASPDVAQAAERAMSALHRVTRDDQVVTVGLEGSPQALEVLAALQQGRFGAQPRQIESFELKDANLQDVFLEFTGRSLRN
ncbi:ABC transporter ATP-binding protein [Micromonospora arborensis]|uniref:ABC transporter ATP-binding protein n=1 Tax=Micromonospora arborensis TaxID=2116518 RepID=UPI00341ECCC4